MNDSDFDGLLLIGDPHISSRTPGFRKDNYPEVILSKLIWLLNHAQANHLLPILLGDLFHLPRDNANWLVVRLMEAFRSRTVLGVVGNHDTRIHTLEEDDTLAILEAAGSICLVDRTGPWLGTVNSRSVLVGGSTWSSALPKSIDRAALGVDDLALVIWIAHHDIAFPGYEGNAWNTPVEIDGIDIVVNGHIHTPRESVQTGSTTWLNPGNIARVSRGDSHRERTPRALRLDIGETTWSSHEVVVPHQPFDDVFYAIGDELGAQEINVSAFVQGLESLRTLRTTSGEGLLQFLDSNLHEDTPNVRNEIMDLAKEVLNSEHRKDRD